MFLCLMDVEACDRVNRVKMFEIMREFGFDNKLVSLVERVYEGSEVYV